MMFGDVLVADRLAFDTAGRAWIDAIGQELQRADAVMAKRSQHAVGVRAVGADPFGNTPANGVIVRKQVVEDVGDWRADIAVFAQGQRE